MAFLTWGANPCQSEPAQDIEVSVEYLSALGNKCILKLKAPSPNEGHYGGLLWPFATCLPEDGRVSLINPATFSHHYFGVAQALIRPVSLDRGAWGKAIKWATRRDINLLRQKP